MREPCSWGVRQETCFPRRMLRPARVAWLLCVSLLACGGADEASPEVVEPDDELLAGPEVDTSQPSDAEEPDDPDEPFDPLQPIDQATKAVVCKKKITV